MRVINRLYSQALFRKFIGSVFSCKLVNRIYWKLDSELVMILLHALFFEQKAFWNV